MCPRHDWIATTLRPVVPPRVIFDCRAFASAPNENKIVKTTRNSPQSAATYVFLFVILALRLFQLPKALPNLPSAEQLSDVWDEGRHVVCVSTVSVAELGNGFPFLSSRQPHVHPDQEWKHCER